MKSRKMCNSLKVTTYKLLKMKSSYRRQCFLPKGKSFTSNSGTKASVLSKGRSSANTETKVSVPLATNRCSSFPLLSAHHYLFSVWTDFKRSEKISGSTTWTWGKWIWLTGPSGLHRNSPQGLNISFIRVFFLPDQRSGNPNNPSSPKWSKWNKTGNLSYCLNMYVHTRKANNGYVYFLL